MAGRAVGEVFWGDNRRGQLADHEG